MVRLKNELTPNVIEAKDLKDGQIAVIVEDYNDYKGRVVQRYKDTMITIGKSWKDGWSDITYNKLKVRILEDGEILVVTNNK